MLAARPDSLINLAVAGAPAPADQGMSGNLTPDEQAALAALEDCRGVLPDPRQHAQARLHETPATAPVPVDEQRSAAGHEPGRAGAQEHADQRVQRDLPLELGGLATPLV